MASRHHITDDEILAGVRALEAAAGYATYDHLARRLGRSFPAVVRRVYRLRDAGRLHVAVPNGRQPARITTAPVK